MELISYVPGRIRFREKKVYKNNTLSKALDLYLSEIKGVKKSRVNPNIGTVTVYYNSNLISEKILRSKIISVINNEAYLNYISKHFKEYLEINKKLQIAKKKMIVFGSIYLLYKIKQHFWGKFSISRSLPVLKIAALVTIIKGYPQIKKTYKNVAQYFPTDSDKFLLVLGIFLTLSREGNKGTMMLFLKAFTDTLVSLSNLQVKKAILANNSNPYSLVWLNHGESEYLIPLKSIEEGDIITFKENETIAVDGYIVEGKALVNHMYYSGQPEIKLVSKKSKVNEGMIIISGNIKVRVSNIPPLVTKSDILLKNLAISKKVSNYQKRALYLASSLALTSYFITGNTLAPLSVMLLMSPSASKVALNSGIANYLKLLLRNKIMLKNANTIEKIINAKSIVFDKTGTLTKGRLKIVKVEILDNNYSKEQVLEISATCEADICHPVANTFNDFNKGNNSLLEKTIYIPSKGIISNYDGHKVVIGNKDLLSREKIVIPNKQNHNIIDSNYYLPVYVAIDNKLVAKIYMVEEIEDKSLEMVKSLNSSGIEDISIISGDLKRNTGHLASQLDIDSYKGNMSQLDKYKYIKEKANHGSTIMVGDGINDTKAMEEADLSISFISKSCHQAVLQSDCIMEEKNMLLIPRLLDITEKSYYRIQRNIEFSQSYNFIFGLLAALGYIGPFKAKSLNTLNSLLAMFNSLNILNIKPQKDLLI